MTGDEWRDAFFDAEDAAREMVGLAHHLFDHLTDQPDLSDTDVEALRLADLIISLFGWLGCGGEPPRWQELARG